VALTDVQTRATAHHPGSDAKVVAAASVPARDGEESPDRWGFRDTGFHVGPRGHISVTGSRYSLSGYDMPELFPWMRRTLGLPIPADDVHPSNYPVDVPPATANPAFLRALGEVCAGDARSDDPLVRLRHGHGHTVEEMYAIKYTGVARVPDLVLFPRDEREVAAIVSAAARHNVMVVPFGGGTNVTNALRCPPGERRMIVSVDLRRMSRVLRIDTDNRMAVIEAGAVGRDIQAHLKRHGFTLGHEPDSVEFSTLGGWIATNASGMKKNRYGNIEDIVIDLRAVTATGIVSRSAPAPRESAGIDPRLLLFGSEGTLGIITEAVVRIRPLPEVERHDAILFPTFEAGFAFMRELAREQAVPASIRLVDNLQFQLSQMLKPGATGVTAVKRRIERAYVTRVRGLDPTRMAACTVVFEGRARDVAREQRAVRRIASRHGGLSAGAENGRKGYEMTFAIAYLRDFVMRHFILAESFETSVAWSDALALCDRVKRRIHDEYARRRLPGRPFVTSRVTQVYETGVAIYFYFGFHHQGVEDPIGVYSEIERAARDEILNAGGSVSHHHGVGKIRQGFLPRVASATALEWAAGVKRAIDPANTFGIGNQ
jgi:alkyldihydroxyacetonephosphate synthase